MLCKTIKSVPLTRESVLPERELPDSQEILSKGEALAKTWRIGHSEFLAQYQCASESEYKQKMMASNRIMQHAHVGFRDKNKSKQALSEIHELTQRKGVTIDRYGHCLDWSMGFPRAIRDQKLKGTGLILDTVEQFVEIANAAPVAAHFGDFVLGFPAALENTQYALSAGSTIIGNLGQYFTFRLPNWTDDIETTRATLTAIALMSSQSTSVLVHSNLDDGFAAVFGDLSCTLGAARIEKYLIETLMGGRVTHCFGHHYRTPRNRLAFQRALTRISSYPGSMIYGNTVSYQGNNAENYASLSSYILIDILGQMQLPSGHAINPVPVTENRRIPDIDEIVDAQLAAGKLVESGNSFRDLLDMSEVDNEVEILLHGSEQFARGLLNGFEEAGIDIRDPFEMFLAIRRLGGKRLETLYGPGQWNTALDRRTPLVRSDVMREIEQRVQGHLRTIQDSEPDIFNQVKLKVVVATTDVHEHSKWVIEGVFRGIGLEVIDGGVSVDPDVLAAVVERTSADVIALTTYNGVALTYYGQLQDELKERGLSIPVLLGGQLNEIPRDSKTSLPVNVESELVRQGAHICHAVEDAIPVLTALDGQ